MLAVSSWVKQDGCR